MSLPLSTVGHRSLHYYKDSIVIVGTEESQDGEAFIQLLDSSMVSNDIILTMYSIITIGDLPLSMP